MQRGDGEVGRRWLVTLAVALALAGGVAVGIAAVGVGGPGQSADGPAMESGVAATDDPSTGANAGGAPASAAQSGDGIVERVAYDRLPAKPDVVEARITYTVPETVDGLSFQITRGEYDVVGLDGFERTDDGSFEWDGSGDGGTVTIRHDVTESFRDEPAGRQYVGGTDEWAIVSRPQTRTSYRFAGSASDPGVEYRLGVASEGYAGTQFAFLGAHEAPSRTVDGERLTLVVPDAADPASEPTAILDSLANASEYLRFGNRNEEVVTIAAPASIDWGPPGVAIGPDTRVSADQAVDAPVNVWVHEYVHTQQYRDPATSDGDAVAGNAHWLIEGSAEYYAARSSLREGRIDFETFRRVLERGTTRPATDAVLADRSTWDTTDAEYEKGALVAGAIDRELRAATNSSVTFQDVMAEWNSADTFDAADLESFAADRAGADVEAFVREHTRTDATPTPRDRATHRRLFDGEVARFDYRLVGEPALSVGGPYRDGALAEPLVPGETVAARVQVENVGQVAGGFRATLVADGRERAVETGDLAPGETTTVDLSATVASAGSTRIVVGGEARTVRVAEPADPVVSQLAVRPKSPAVGDAVDVTATVANPTGRPAAGDVRITAGNETIATRFVQVAPGENATVTYTTSFDRTGTVAVAAGELSVDVGVQDAGPIEDALPGVGVAGSLLALAIGAIALARRR